MSFASPGVPPVAGSRPNGCGRADHGRLWWAAMSDSPSTGDYELVVVANRLPVDRVVDEDGSIRWRRSPGGLVAAVEPIMQRHEGAWVGWDGGTDGPDDAFDDDG